MEDIFKCPYKHQKESAPDYFRIILRMNYGIELFNLKLKSNEDYTSKSIKTLLMSPSTMKNELLKIAKNLENEREKFDVENFKFNNLRLFWNLIWYFELNQMDSSFMLPYTNEVQNDDNLNLENLKKFIDTKYIPEKDINIEKIVKNPNLNFDILFCSNRDSLQGQSINEEEIKNDLFIKNKNRYEKYDLVIQKIFRLHISDKNGMISYMSFNNYSENIGFNEYPTQFKEIPEINLDNINEPKSLLYKDTNDINITKNTSNILLNDDKFSESSPNLINKNYNKFKTTNLDYKKDKKSALMKPRLQRTKRLNYREIEEDNINKEENKKINEETKVEGEIKENEEEEVDVLSQFKENQKNIIQNELEEYDLKNITQKNNLFAQIKVLRKSTLRNGILGGENDE